jgi:hypothetical protein
MAAKSNYQFVIKDLPSDYSLSELKAIGQDFIDHIIKRTQEGKGVNSKKWKGSQANKYSESYKKSLEFNIGGKNKNGPVNLELSGDMLSMLEVVDVKKGKIVIGYDGSDSKLTGKVEGNRIGSYGGDPNPKKARDFLEIGRDDKKEVLKNYPIDDKQERLERTRLMNQLIRESKTYQDIAIENAEED